MILADKIIELRKKAGWSQEELAEQLGVTRQSVSKWEGAQSVPDMEKVVQMSRLFGVTTDFLLKDELEVAQPAESETGENLRRVTMEEASLYLSLRKAAAPKMALATFLCVLSPIPLILLSGLSETAALPLSENTARGLGLCVLLLLIAVAVTMFLLCASKVRAFAFLEKESFETAYGVTGMVQKHRAAFQKTYTRCNIGGTVLCILAVLPRFASICFSVVDIVYVAAVCLLLFMAACGCFLFVLGGTYEAAMQKLLEEGDYTRKNKASSGVYTAISTGYWLLVTAVFLFYTFGPNGNGQAKYSWFIWAIGGVLYGVLAAALGAIRHMKR